MKQPINTAPLLSHLSAEIYTLIRLLPANVGRDSTSNMCQMCSYVQITVSVISFISSKFPVTEYYNETLSDYNGSYA